MAEAKSTHRAPSFKDLTGQRFGRLVAISLSGNNRHRAAIWLCQCDCGTIKEIIGNSLRRGMTTSCGCLQKERVISACTTHGMSKSPENSIWRSMLSRCHNKKDRAYHNYGGRGIKVCDRWQHSFEAFYADMGPRPTKQHSIERRHNNCAYDPGNCYWATRKQQNRNTRYNRMLTFRGETRCVAEWAETIGVSCSTLHSRIHLGWSVERMLTTPVGR